MFTKKFCCSNNAATVAKMLALIDMVFSVLMIFILSSFVHIFLHYPQTLRTMTEENPEKQEDLRKFLVWGPKKKALMLSVPFTGSILNGFKGILLFFGAQQRSLKAIKIWLVLTFIFLMTGLLAFVTEVIFTQDKGLIVGVTLVDWIYEAYSIWIVKCLFFELLQENRVANRSVETMQTTLSPPPSFPYHSHSPSPSSAKSQAFLNIETTKSPSPNTQTRTGTNDKDGNSYQ